MKKILVSMVLLLVASGCSTSIRSYPVPNSDIDRKGGVPYFIPKAMLQISEPIEVKREESLFAVINVGGLDEYLLPLNSKDLDASIKDLENILNKPVGSISVKGAHLEPIYLNEETTSSNITEEQYKSTVSSHTKKFSALVIADSNKDGVALSSPFYKPTDIEKSLSIVWIPDYTKEYELVINPSWFASSEISITLADGWRLEAISSKTGENQLIKELSTILQTVVGSQKEIKVAKIAKDQAVKLKELELAGKDTDEKLNSFRDETELVVKVKGYVKKSELSVIKPGIYDLSKILSTVGNGKVEFPTSDSILWSRVKL